MQEQLVIYSRSKPVGNDVDWLLVVTVCTRLPAPPRPRTGGTGRATIGPTVVGWVRPPGDGQSRKASPNRPTDRPTRGPGAEPFGARAGTNTPTPPAGPLRVPPQCRRPEPLPFLPGQVSTRSTLSLLKLVPVEAQTCCRRRPPALLRSGPVGDACFLP